MEAIFSATPTKGKLVFDNRVDYEDYLLENEGIPLKVELSHEAKTSQKLLMYAYLFKVVFGAAVKGYAQQGYEGIDRVAARYKLQAEFAKGEIYNKITGEVEIYLLSLSKMSKFRLLKFMQDCIFFIETELKQRVPDSQTYKEMKLKEKENGK